MPPYENTVPNGVLMDLMKNNLEAIGLEVATTKKRTSRGSTDFGNVSHRVPAAYAYLGICGPEAGWHSSEVAAATKTARGHAAIVAGAKSLAMTAIDLLVDDALREEARREHEAAMRPIRAGLARLEAAGGPESMADSR